MSGPRYIPRSSGRRILPLYYILTAAGAQEKQERRLLGNSGPPAGNETLDAIGYTYLHRSDCLRPDAVGGAAFNLF